MLKRVFEVCRVEGLNQARFIETVKKRGVNLYNVVKYSNKSMSVQIKKQDFKKFFAISKDLCYNVKRIRTTGSFAPIYWLISNVGILTGSVIFLIICFLSSNIIFSFSFTGSGRVLERELTNYLYSEGITPFTSFSKIDFSSLSDEILKNNSSLTFAEVKKNGNRLEVYTVLKTGEDIKPSLPVYELSSDRSGVIEDIKVYRGTPLVKVGDEIKKGDILVSGYSVIKDKPITLNVIAKITLSVLFEYSYISEKKGEEDIALSFAEEALGDRQITERVVKKTLIEGKYHYEIKLYYKHIIITE